MTGYVPNTPEEQQQMLKECGFSGFEDLYADIPEQVRLGQDALRLPDGMPEIAVRRAVEEMAAQTKVYLYAISGGDQPGRTADDL